MAIGLYRYVSPDEYLLQGILGLIAVVLGGMAPASILTGTAFGSWLVGGSPTPLALGLALVVVLCVVLLRRIVIRSTEPTVDSVA